MIYQVKGYHQYKFQPEIHQNLLVNEVVFVDSSENIITPDHKYRFRDELSPKLASSKVNFLDINGVFVFQPDKVLHSGLLIEFWVPRGWCIKQIQYDDTKLDYFHLYSERGKKAHLRYNFFLNKSTRISISGVLVKDVNSLFERLIKAEFDTKKRNKIRNETIAPKRVVANKSKNKPKKYKFKRDEVRVRYGSLLTDTIKGKITSEKNFKTELRNILNNPSIKLPKYSKSLFNQNGNPIQWNICEILSLTYIGSHKTISPDTFRDIYDEIEERRKNRRKTGREFPPSS